MQFMVVMVIYHGKFIRQVTMENLSFLQIMRLIITYYEIFCLLNQIQQNKILPKDTGMISIICWGVY